MSVVDEFVIEVAPGVLKFVRERATAELVAAGLLLLLADEVPDTIWAGRTRWWKPRWRRAVIRDRDLRRTETALVVAPWPRYRWACGSGSLRILGRAKRRVGRGNGADVQGPAALPGASRTSRRPKARRRANREASGVAHAPTGGRHSAAGREMAAALAEAAPLRDRDGNLPPPTALRSRWLLPRWRAIGSCRST